MRTAYNTDKIIKITYFEEHEVDYPRYRKKHWLLCRSGPKVNYGLGEGTISQFEEQYGDTYKVVNEQVIKKALIRIIYPNYIIYEERFETNEEAERRYKILAREYKLIEKL